MIAPTAIELVDINDDDSLMQDVITSDDVDDANADASLSSSSSNDHTLIIDSSIAVDSSIVITSPSSSIAPPPPSLLTRFIPARLIGIFYLAFSAFLFSLMALLVSILSRTLPSFEIVFIRCLLQFTFGWSACQFYRIPFLGPIDRRKWLAIRGTIGFVAFSLYYYAIAHLTLADATTVFFTAPLYTGIFGFMFLGESLARFDIACACTSVVGVVMIVRPPFIFGTSDNTVTNGGVDMSTADGNGGGSTLDAAASSSSPSSMEHTLGILAALSGALISAMVYIAIRKIGPGVAPLVLVVWMGLAGSLISPFGALIQTFIVPPSITIWAQLLMVGILSFVGQIFFNAGVQREKAGPASMIRNLDVAFSFIWQLTIQGIAASLWSVGGAIIVSASVVAMGIKKWRATNDAERNVTIGTTIIGVTSTTVSNGVNDDTTMTTTTMSYARERRTSSAAATGTALHELIHDHDGDDDEEVHDGQQQYGVPCDASSSFGTTRKNEVNSLWYS